MTNGASVRKQSLKMAGLAVWVALTAGTAPASYVITTSGQRIDGTDIRAKSDGEIILMTAQGTRNFLKGQYTKAVADRPPEIDAASKAVQAKNYDEAIRLLEDVARRFMFLDWDNQARILLPKVYMEKGDFAAAVGAYDKLFTMSPTARDNPDVQWSFRTALLKAKQYDKLETQLNDVIMKGPRPDAARAQIMRGDIRMAQNQIEPAALDYLRTVVLFKAEADYQAEAMFKAADALEKLRDGRAKDWYRKVVEQYPQSPYAAQARAKL